MDLFFSFSLDEHVARSFVRACVRAFVCGGRWIGLPALRRKMLEMLAAFSTAPDKSMSLADFERMMVATRMA